MAAPRPKTLWLAMARETLRLTLLTAAISAVVVAFAAGIQPLADGRLGPGDALKYMALAAPAMLQFVLPFAAGFGATLSHHRMASENELTAAVSAGLSRGALLAPTLALGLSLAILLGVFNNFAMPRLLRGMSNLVRKDAARLIVSAIRRGDSADLGGVRIHADSVATEETARNGDEHIVLTGVVALTLDETGRPESDVAAQVADVWLRRDRVDGEDATVVIMRLTGAAFKRPGQAWSRQEQMELKPWLAPADLADNPNFRTLPQLLALIRDPSAQRDVDRRRRELAAAAARVEVVRQIEDELAAQSRLDLQASDGARLALRAGGARVVDSAAADPPAEAVSLDLSPSAGETGVRLEWFEADGSIRRQIARSAALTLRVSADADRFEAALTLTQVAMDAPAQVTRERVERSGLSLLRDPAPALFALSWDALIARVHDLLETGAQDPTLSRRLTRLRVETRRIRRVAVGNIHERAALSLACAVMMLSGAVAAMLFTQVSPLVVYLWSFLPSLLGVIAISGGENAVDVNPPVGLAALWGGVGVVGLVALAMFLKVRRH